MLNCCDFFFLFSLLVYWTNISSSTVILDVIVGNSLLVSNQIEHCHLVRQAGEDSDCDYYRDSSSDGSCDYEIDKVIKFTREQQACLHLTSEVLGRLSLNDEQSGRQEGFSSDDGEAENSQGRLLFEFLEQDLPYCRVPLADKVS
jgi:hypothetical protein